MLNGTKEPKTLDRPVYLVDRPGLNLFQKQPKRWSGNSVGSWSKQ